MGCISSCCLEEVCFLEISFTGFHRDVQQQSIGPLCGFHRVLLLPIGMFRSCFAGIVKATHQGFQSF